MRHHMQPTRRLRTAQAVSLLGLLLLGCGTARMVSGTTDPELARVDVTPAAVTMQKDETIDLSAVGFAASGDSVEIAVTWAATGGTMISESTVGRRHVGRYRSGQTCGSYSVIATGAPGGAADTVAISITCTTIPVASVDVTPTSVTESVGATQQLVATPKAADGTALAGRTVTWTTSAASVATVSQSGLVTAVAVGTATITATSEAKSGTSAITVVGSSSTLVTDPSLVFDVPATSKPAYLTPVRLGPFGTTVVRIANDPGTTFTTTTGSGTWGPDARHHYQKDQPWNATGTLIAIDNYQGTTRHVFLDADTYLPKYGHCGNYSKYEDRWHPSRQHATERINVNRSQLMWFDVVTCTMTRSWTLPFSAPGIGPWEGNPSADGRFIALTDSSRMVVVDMDPQPPYAPYPSARIGPTQDLTDCGLSGGCTIDYVSVSPSGRYVVVAYNGAYNRVYDVDPATLALTPRPMPVIHSGCHGTAAKGFIYDLGHADMALNPFDNNEDVMIGQEHCGNRGKTVSGVLAGGVMMVRLRDGAIKPLTHPSNEAYPHHISARNTERPGWVYVGYYADAGKRFNDEIIAVRMDGSYAVERLAHKHSVFSGCYRCESHAVPSLDGKRVVFASNWYAACGSGCGKSNVIQAYVVDTRP
jgi:hypothetical protein